MTADILNNASLTLFLEELFLAKAFAQAIQIKIVPH